MKQTRGATGLYIVMMVQHLFYSTLVFMLYLMAPLRIIRYEKDGYGYLYEIDAHINDMSRLIEGQAQFVIDSTNYGNVSRFINHR